MPQTTDAPLIFASGSTYKRALLERLGVSVTHERPDVDETPLDGETAGRLARRLADAKVRRLSERYPERWVLGGDQAAACGERLLGKPGSIAAAQEQIAYCSGKPVVFVTAITLACKELRKQWRAHDVTTVRFRSLTDAEIRRYVQREPALDCAGGFKVEGLGISLFERVDSRDPTALIGLPLIAVRRLLARAGLPVP